MSIIKNKNNICNGDCVNVTDNFKLKKRGYRLAKNRFFLLAFAFLFLFIGIGFAYIQSSLSITGSSTIPSGMWDVYFANLSVTSGSMTPATAATISSDKKNINFALVFKDINDYYEFEVDVVNNGTLDAMVSGFAVSGITSAYQDYLKYTITYSNGGAAVKDNDKLSSKSTSRIKIKVYFNKEANVTNAPVDSGMTLSINIPYVQATS